MSVPIAGGGKHEQKRRQEKKGIITNEEIQKKQKGRERPDGGPKEFSLQIGVGNIGEKYVARPGRGIGQVNGRRAGNWNVERGKQKK